MEDRHGTGRKERSGREAVATGEVGRLFVFVAEQPPERLPRLIDSGSTAGAGLILKGRGRVAGLKGLDPPHGKFLHVGTLLVRACANR